MLLKLALVAASVLLASLVARRFGHAVGGTVAGLPMIAGPIMGFVLWQEPAQAARAIALATVVCLPATAAHLLTFAWCARRWHWALAWLAANVVFLAVGSVLTQLPLPPPWAAVAATASLVVGRACMPSDRLAAGTVPIPRTELACRVAAAVALAWVIVRTAGVVPAALSGLLLALPITGNVLPCFTLPRHGAAATAALLAGFMRGLLGFLAFFVALVLLLEPAGNGPAYVAAWSAALLAAFGLYAVPRWRRGGTNGTTAAG